jgi:hypothetical protein
MSTITLDKINVACSQLDTAIRMWFYDDDPISIHTLVCSAYQIIHDINSVKGKRDLIYDSALIKDEYRREWSKKVKEPYNFFKHADNDPDEIIDFNPESSILYFLFSCVGLQALNKQLNITRYTFVIYLYLLKPECLTDKGKALVSTLIKDEQRQSILFQPKRNFFELSKIILKGKIADTI